MPEYLRVQGNVVEQYKPDGFSKVLIVDTGFEYRYAVEPPRLSRAEERQLSEALEELAYILKPGELLSPEALEAKLREMGLAEEVIIERIEKRQ